MTEIERENLVKDTHVAIDSERSRLIECTKEAYEKFKSYTGGDTALVVTGSLRMDGRQGEVRYNTVLLATKSVEMAVDKAIESAKTVAMMRYYDEAKVESVGLILYVETVSKGTRLTDAIAIHFTNYR